LTHVKFSAFEPSKETWREQQTKPILLRGRMRVMVAYSE
jgi:hypothetical protein